MLRRYIKGRHVVKALIYRTKKIAEYGISEQEWKRAENVCKFFEEATGITEFGGRQN